MPTKKCCIRNSRRRKCTKRNMCPRKKCKRVYVLNPNQVPESPQNFNENFIQVPQSPQNSNENFIQEPQNIQNFNDFKPKSCVKERKQIQFLVKKIATLSEENKKIDELWDKLANAYESIDKNMDEKNIFNVAMEGVSNEHKRDLKRLYSNVTECKTLLEQKNVQLQKLKNESNWESINKNLEIKKLNEEISGIKNDYKVFIKKLKLIFKNKLKALENLKNENQNELIDLKQQNKKLVANDSLQKILLRESINKAQTNFEEKRILQSTLGRVAKESKNKINELQQALKNLAGSSRERVDELVAEIESQKQDLHDFKEYIKLYKVTTEHKDARIEKLLSTKFGKKHIGDYKYLLSL